MSDRVKLSYDEAVAMLPDREYIHTFRQGGYNILVGGDWELDDLLVALMNGNPELSGDVATSMKHRLVFFDEFGACFVETKPAQPTPAGPEGE